MKNTLSLLASLACLPFFLIAQPRNGTPLRQRIAPTRQAPTSRFAPETAKVASHNDYPTLSYYFSWNNNATAWDSVARNTISYTSTGLADVITQESYGVNGFELYGRSTNTYNAQGLAIEYLSEYWDGSAWILDQRTEVGYDAFVYSIWDFGFSWNGVSWDSTYGRRSQVTYVLTDKIGQEIVEYWDQQLPVWTPSDRIDYHWPNAQGWDTITSYIYNSGWDVDGRAIVYGWHNLQEELPDSALLQVYNGTGWDNDESMRVTYGLHDGYDWLYYNWGGTTWEPYSREVVVRDSLEHEILFENYDWSGSWSHTYGYAFDYFYDGQGRTTEIISDEYDSQTGQYAHYARTLYPSFFTSAPAPKELLIGVTAFPNPCTDALNFQLSLPENAAVQVSLYDLQGRLRVQTQAPRLAQGQVTMPISGALENGTYVYRVSTKAGMAQGKVVVQR